MTLPYKFQLQDIRKCERHGIRNLVAWDMGLGKSLMSLMVFQRNFLEAGGVMVVVCPAGLKTNWEREAFKHLRIRARVLEGTKPPRTKGLFRTSQLYIVNYEILGKRQSKHSGPGWLDFLLGLEPSLVVLDESHAVANYSSKRTKWCRQLCKKVPHLLLLSGTPLTSRPKELWPSLNILDPDTYPSFFAFGRRYCNPKVTRWGIDFSGASNLEELHGTLTSSGLMVRRTKDDVLKDLPEKRRVIVPFKLPKAGQSEYDLALKDFRGWITANRPELARKALKAEQLSKLSHIKRLAAEHKLPLVFDWIDNFLEGSNDKLILFAIHRSIVNKVHSKYSKLSVVVDGSVTGEHRTRATDQFLNKKETRLLIGNIKAAGVGWSAPGVSDVAFLELAWSPGEHTQASDRIRGIGRGRKGRQSTSWFLVAENTIEEKLLQINQKKQKVLNAVVDGDKAQDSFDVFDELCKVLLRDSHGRVARRE